MIAYILIILLTLLSLVLYMANRELNQELKIQEYIIQMLTKRNDDTDIINHKHLNDSKEVDK
ncbi:hypothetical protein BTZ13_09485 [Staphylococcus condimenti]|uniref:hypothetical protein n=1 Tax=Staphylococcus condimenti TaxID=70255 RepID=UPI000947672C|nr:hypothetical protein [Staphylococcus condimenti]APR61433.1 hypothetical protein BTZ13_09485 [Staphylococcus condimenti]MDK8646300.1 hypothetical protein [Staphylococcus condimenti]